MTTNKREITRLINYAKTSTAFFGVSLYLAITQLQLSVNVNRHRYKKLNNSLILRAGYPELSLKARYTDLIYYDFGYGLKGDWHFSYDEYQIWQQNHLMLI